MATLFIASGPKEGQWFPIRHKSLVVGRDEGLLARIVAPGVSRKHFQISFDPVKDCYRLTDMGSKNGVLLNNKAITEIVDLKNDDLICAGDALLFFSTADFNDDQKCGLKFYRLRGQRSVETHDQDSAAVVMQSDSNQADSSQSGAAAVKSRTIAAIIEQIRVSEQSGRKTDHASVVAAHPDSVPYLRRLWKSCSVVTRRAPNPKRILRPSSQRNSAHCRKAEH